jgi:hypothetical protein
MPILNRRTQFILYLYDCLAACEDEEEAQKLVELIDLEESYLPHPPPRGTILDEMLLAPYRTDDP